MTARIGGKTGGRKRGSLDKSERQVVTSEMASDLLTVYKRLGGVKWLLEFAKNNPGEFIRSGLSRLWPAPQKDDPDFVQNNQFNIGDLSEMEAARRVSFCLAKAAHQLEQELEPVAEVTPQEACRPAPWQNVPNTASLLKPEPIDNPAQAEWAASLHLTPDQKLVRETRETTIENYRGGDPAEQGGTVRSQSSATTRKPTAAELTRRMSRRSELL
jgi:hypothetical protein